MPLERHELESIQCDCAADDIEIPDAARAWSEEEAYAFFESGGTAWPNPQGLEATELLAGIPHALLLSARGRGTVSGGSCRRTRCTPKIVSAKAGVGDARFSGSCDAGRLAITRGRLLVGRRRRRTEGGRREGGT